MAKMGYQAGQGLGAGGSGRVAPIEVDVKGSKAGLGVEEAAKRRQAEADLLSEGQGAQPQRGGCVDVTSSIAGNCVLFTSVISHVYFDRMSVAHM